MPKPGTCACGHKTNAADGVCAICRLDIVADRSAIGLEKPATITEPDKEIEGEHTMTDKTDKKDKKKPVKHHTTIDAGNEPEIDTTGAIKPTRKYTRKPPLQPPSAPCPAPEVHGDVNLKITIDFSKHRALYDSLVEAARENFRQPDGHIMFIINNGI
jgi:hypothetical protein